ncbi:MAG: SMI1/KNR4 family protein [Planctomycetota bacterium]
MELNKFKEFVLTHIDQYRGVNAHSEDELSGFESTLGFELPDSLRWLLKKHGYGNATGVANLSEAVATTLALRGSRGLSEKLLILNDWGDAGVVILDMDSGECCWCAVHEVEKISKGQRELLGADWYKSFADWSCYRCEELED